MQFPKKKSNSQRISWENLKKSIYPANKTERAKRLKQFRDLGIFLTSIIIVCVFEKKIKNLLKVDKSEITQFNNMQSSIHSAY